MTILSQRQREIEERFSVIEDPHERLNAIIRHRLKGMDLQEDERTDGQLVRGCASPVWLRVAVVNGELEIRYAASSVMVKGLVALLVELYLGVPAADAKGFTPRLLENLGLDRMLSGTRLHGLAQVVRTIREAADVG